MPNPSRQMLVRQIDATEVIFNDAYLKTTYNGI